MYGTGSQSTRLTSNTYKPIRPTTAGEVRWPVDGKSLQALVDLGMTDQRIADYFRVSVTSITEMKARHAARQQSEVR